MAWYIVRTGINAKDMFGAVAYVESDVADLHEMDDEKAHTIISEIHPDFQCGQYIENISKLEEWDLKSKEYGSKEEFMKDFGEIVGTSSNDSYTLIFDRISVKEARRMEK